MPLFSIYSLALEQDQEQSVGLQLANATLHNQTFIQVNVAAALFGAPVIPRLTRSCCAQPLVQRHKEHEKKRKEIKELWIRAKRKLVKCLKRAGARSNRQV